MTRVCSPTLVLCLPGPAITLLAQAQFGRTLKALNYSLKNRISDHNPLIVELRW